MDPKIKNRWDILPGETSDFGHAAAVLWQRNSRLGLLL